jgi:hypothetical protein
MFQSRGRWVRLLEDTGIALGREAGSTLGMVMDLMAAYGTKG